MKAGQVKI